MCLKSEKDVSQLEINEVNHHLHKSEKREDESGAEKSEIRNRGSVLKKDPLKRRQS